MITYRQSAVKLLSDDPNWRNLSALSYHFLTQPLPTPLAWYAAHMLVVAYGTRRALAHAFLPILHFAGLENVVAVSHLRPVSEVALFLELFNGRFYGFGS